MVTTAARNIVLQFDPALDRLPNGKRLSNGMSAVVAIGDALWLTHDESVSLERLRVIRATKETIRYADHRRYALSDFVSLPAAAKLSQLGAADVPEADLEGIAFCEEYLWVTGSHSAVRDRSDGRDMSDRIAALAKVRRTGNRFLLARIPLEQGAAGRVPVARLRTEDGRCLTAARLRGGKRNNCLTRMLRDDPHLGPFLTIPSKDNGFDIEGLAAAPNGRLFLGLRGPVLDGWACVLEVHVAADPLRDDRLMLRGPSDRFRSRPASTLYRKHFLDLGGAGVRDLCLVGSDLLILTGPSMRGEGTAQVRRWKNALRSQGERMLHGNVLRLLLELPYREKKDHPEGIAVVGRAGDRIRLLVIYDSARKNPRLSAGAMRATIFDLAVNAPRSAPRK